MTASVDARRRVTTTETRTVRRCDCHRLMPSAPTWSATPSSTAKVRRATSTRRGRSTSPTTRCRPGARRSGGSRRSSGCVACTRTPTSAGARPRARGTTRPRASASSASTGDEARAARLSGLRADRPGQRRGPGRGPPTSLLVDVPAETELDRAGRRRRSTATGVDGADGRPPRDHGPSAHSKATVVLATPAPRRWPTTSRSSSATAPTLTVVSLQDWADDAVHLSHHQRPRSAATRRYKHVAVTFGGDLVRHDATVTYAGPGGAAELLGLYFADAGQHIEHRLFVDHNAPHTKQPRRLQGRAAGRGRAHRLGRQRADPQGRRGHRDLRGEPQPGAHRRLPGRLGAQPGDRDRRDRGRRPRLRHRPLRRRAAVLPAVARHRRGRGAPAGRARLLRRPHPQDRRARDRGAAARRRSRPSWPRTSTSHAALRVGDDASSAPARSPRSPTDQALARRRRRPRRGRRPRRRRGLRASQDECSHAAVAALRGRRRATAQIECWLHGSRFDLRTGKPTGLAGHRAGRRSTPSRSTATTCSSTSQHRSTATERRRHDSRQSETSNGTLEIKDLHVTVDTEDGPKEILKGVDLTIKRRRDPRDHGPQRLGQVHAGLLDRRPPEVHGHRRHGDPRRRRTCSR